MDIATADAERRTQQVLDAVVGLQARRAQAVHDFREGRSGVGVDLYAAGADINARLRREAPRWRSVLSARRGTTVEQLRHTLPVNRRVIARGASMLSVFDEAGLSPRARDLIAGEGNAAYRFGFVPIQMKLVDRQHVLLEGPVLDGCRTVLSVSASATLAAARAYWVAVLAGSTVDAREPGCRQFSDRQRQVMALMATDVHDEQIADALDVSVRTVRADIARILATLGVTTRYAAGLRVGAGEA